MLFSPQELLLFAIAALVLVLTPGPNMVYCVSRSLTQGPRAGLVSLAGVLMGFLVHLLAAACTALSALDMDRGAVITASRPTPHGLLQWQITVRDDGLRLMDGCLPTLIQWGAVHPCSSLPASGVQLQELTLQHPQAATLQAACEAVGMAASVVTTPGHTPRLSAQLSTPRGPVTLASRTPE